MDKSSLIIRVGNLLNSSVGSSENHEINAKIADEEDIKFANPINVKIKIINADNKLLTKVCITGFVGLICSRCARDFDCKIATVTDATFSSDEGGEYLISSDLTIDLLPVVREAILIEIPIKRLCSEKCQGIEMK